MTVKKKHLKFAYDQLETIARGILIMDTKDLIALNDILRIAGHHSTQIMTREDLIKTSIKT